MRLNNVTVANNSSGDAAAGDGIDFGSGSHTLKNTVVADNSGIDTFCDSTITINYSIIETNTGCGAGGNNIFNADPGLSGLADNGGPTETHALGGGSNAIDSGDTTAAAGQPAGPV